jgi:hypothetical protein
VLDDEREALLAGPLGGLPVDVLRVLCRDAVTLDVPAGSDLFRSGMSAFVVFAASSEPTWRTRTVVS